MLRILSRAAAIFTRSPRPVRRRKGNFEGFESRCLLACGVGDANCDGYFNSSDLVTVFQAGKYENNRLANAAFSEGDWNRDGYFNSSDLVLAFRVGRYEQAAVSTRGSNSQLRLPRNLYLADINADGRADFLQVAENRIFASETDFEKTGILHAYLTKPIKRLVTGDFAGEGYDQVCAIRTDEAFECYGTSTDRTELWWWLTQQNFIADHEDSIVADFNGDGQADILVYNRRSGGIRMFTIDDATGFFAPMASFTPGNLAGAAGNLQLRAGDVNSNGRDDLIVINPSGQVLFYDSVFDGSNDTFWWAWTSRGGVVQSGDQVQLARIDDNRGDDLVLHNVQTGATRFHRLVYNDGQPPLLNVPTGQIANERNSLIFFDRLKERINERGGVRDDSLTYLTSRDQFFRADARWDGSQSTYWWAYTQAAPRNDVGWAPIQSTPWLILKCKIADRSAEPNNDTFYRELFTADGWDGVVNYWRDISYGSYDLTGNVLNNRWYTMRETYDDLLGLDRWGKINACIRASGQNTAGYAGVIAVLNASIDAGHHNQVLLAPGALNVSFAVHEMAHGYGWGHSFDDTTRKNADWSAPGEYFDHWDIMSAMAIHGFNNHQGVTAGPEMNAPYKTVKNFIPAHRMYTIGDPAGDIATASYEIAAINRPEANGLLMLRIGTDNNDYYTVEFRQRWGWDRGIPRDGVLVHRVLNGRSILLTNNGTQQDRQPGDLVTLPNGVRVRVDHFDTQAKTATVSVEARLPWFDLAAAGSAALGGGSAVVSRIPESMETWWIGANGSIQAAYWYEGGAWQRYELAPAGSASLTGNVAAVSRISNSMELWWVGANGSIQAAYWYEGGNWQRYELAPAGSAARSSSITAVSRIPGSMELWWIGANGSVQGAYWYEGGNWQRYELAPAGSASIDGSIAAVSRIPNSLELWWVGANGSVQGAYWYEGSAWQRYELAPAGSAALDGGLAAVARIPQSMELWWIGADGSVQDAYWYEGAAWQRFELAPAGSASTRGGITAVSRVPGSMEIWWIGVDGSIQDAYWYEGSSWARFPLAPGRSGATGGSIAAVSRIPGSMEVWWIGPNGELRDAFFYDGAGWL